MTINARTALVAFNSCWGDFWLYDQSHDYIPDFVVINREVGKLTIAVRHDAHPLDEFVRYFNSLQGPFVIEELGSEPLTNYYGLHSWVAVRIAKRATSVSSAFDLSAFRKAAK